MRVFVIVLCCMVLVACTNSGEGDISYHGSLRNGPYVFTDKGTGLQYIASSDGGITPRMGPDGKQMREANDSPK